MTMISRPIRSLANGGAVLPSEEQDQHLVDSATFQSPIIDWNEQILHSE